MLELINKLIKTTKTYHFGEQFGGGALVCYSKLSLELE